MASADLAVLEIAAPQHGVVTTAQAMRAGVSTAMITRRVRLGWWQPLLRGAFLVDHAVDPFLARCSAALLVTRRDNTVLSHLTAATLLGVQGLAWAKPNEPIHLSLPREQSRGQRRGIRLHWSAVPDDQVVRVHRMPVTSTPRTLVDLALTTDRLTAVATAEWALRQGQDMAQLRDLASGRLGADRVRSWWQLAEPAAENRLETCARLHLIDGGLPPDAVQFPIVHNGIRIAVADLAYRERRVAVETDGRGPHSEPGQFAWDRRRLILVQEAEWIMISFTWQDMRHPAYLVQSVGRALARAA